MLKRILFLSCFVLFSFGFGIWIRGPIAQSVIELGNLAATFFAPSVTASDLQNKFALAPETRSPVRILIVPGHEPDFGGAEYRDLLERELNLELALKIRELLSGDDRFEVVLSRDENGWNRELESYFSNN